MTGQSLRIDTRATLQGRPGTHAFIVGVDHYPNLPKDGEPDTDRSFGLRQLRWSVASARAFYRWLVEEYSNPAAPLATCRVLASHGEQPAADDPFADVAGASLDDFLFAAHDWRADAALHPESVAIFYFAGNGIQVSKEQVVLLMRDFGQPAGGMLRQAIDLSTLVGGMAPASQRSSIARTQLYVLETVRVPPVSFTYFASTGTTPVWDLELPGLDDRSTTILHASSVPGDVNRAGPSRFARALLDALNGSAAVSIGENENGDPLWAVTMVSLSNGLPLLIARGHQESGHDDMLTLSTGGSLRATPINFLKHGPIVDVQLEIEPPTAAVGGHVSFTNATGQAIVSEKVDTIVPRTYQVPAGLYTVAVTIPGGQVVTRFKEARPPHSDWKIRLT